MNSKLTRPDSRNPIIVRLGHKNLVNQTQWDRVGLPILRIEIHLSEVEWNLSRTQFVQKMGLNPHGQPLPTGSEFDAKLMPNPGRNTGFYRLYRLIKPLERASFWFDPTFTRWKS
jgi:hypothetical protein